MITEKDIKPIPKYISKLIFKEDFNEINCGSAENVNIDDFNKKELIMTFNNYLDSNKKIVISNGKELRQYLLDLNIEYSNVSYPNGESRLECSNRFKKGIIDCFDKYNCNSVAIITHIAVIKSFLSCNIINYENIDNVTKLEYDGDVFRLK